MDWSLDRQGTSMMCLYLEPSRAEEACVHLQADLLTTRRDTLKASDKREKLLKSRQENLESYQSWNYSVIGFH